MRRLPHSLAVCSTGATLPGVVLGEPGRPAGGRDVRLRLGLGRRVLQRRLAGAAPGRAAEPDRRAAGGVARTARLRSVDFVVIRIGFSGISSGGTTLS